MYVIADSSQSLENTSFLTGFYRNQLGRISQSWTHCGVAYAAKYKRRADAVHALRTLSTCRVRYGRPVILKVSL
jgi:hypothetical protein